MSISIVTEKLVRKPMMKHSQIIKYMANEPMELIPVPSALLARRLRSRLGCQKRAGIPHRGR